jgi:D-galactarolactone isomerase
MVAPLAKRITDRGWHVQVNADAALIVHNANLWRVSRVQSYSTSWPTCRNRRDATTRFSGSCCVCSTRAGRGSNADTASGPPAYADSSAIARAYVEAAPERLVWSSDWPHPTEAVRTRILVDNLQRL